MSTQLRQEDSFWGHLEALRQTLLQVMAVVALGFICCLFLHKPLMSVIQSPLSEPGILSRQLVTRERIENLGTCPLCWQSEPGSTVVWTGEGVTSQEGGSWVLKPGGSLIVEYPQPTQALVLLGPTEGLGTIFKLAFWVSLVATSPLWLFLLLRFIAPGLQQTEKAFVLPFLGLSLLALFGGILFAWIFTLPIANSVLRQINAGIGTDLWSLGHYLDYSVILLLGNALAFEGAVLVFFLVHQGYLTPDGMRRCRRHVIVGTLFMSAVLTPPDVFTQLLLTIPLLCLYELSILYAVWRQRCSLALLSEPAL